MISTVRVVTGRVKKWENGDMKKRWIATGMIEAQRSFRPLTANPDRSRVWGVLWRVSAERPSWSAFLGVVTHQKNQTGRALAK